MRTLPLLVASMLYVLPALPAPEAQSKTATVVVALPADAVLEIDGTTMKSTGALRTFETPPLPAGKTYLYTLKATWKEGGKDRTVVREVKIKAGAQVAVDLNPDELSAEEKELLALVNKERAAAGAPALKANPKLMRAARAHSANMAKQGQLNHTLDGKGPTERLADLGYAHSGWGENVVAGQRTPAEAMTTWLNSAGHKANLLNAAFTEIGLGSVAAQDGTRYWTQVFGTPRGQ